MSMLVASRGLGAIIGPLFSARLAGQSDRRLRLGIFFGYLTVAVGYAALGSASSLWVACLCLTLAHGGGSTVLNLSCDGTHATLHVAIEASASRQRMNRV